MFCSKCGDKIVEDAKFCKKCGQAVSAEDKEDKKDKPVPAEEADKKQPSGCAKGCSWAILVFLLIVFFGTLPTYSSQIKNSPGLRVAFWLFGAFFVLLISWYYFRPNKKLEQKKPEQKQETPETPKKTGLVNGISGVITIIVVIIIGFVIYENFKNIHITPVNTADQTATATAGGGGVTADSWDGNYDAQMTKPNCDSLVELTAFQVLEGSVVNLYGKNAPIGTNGKATMVMNYSSGMTVNFTFSSSGSKKSISGTWVSAGKCSGTFQAQRTFGF